MTSKSNEIVAIIVVVMNPVESTLEPSAASKSRKNVGSLVVFSLVMTAPRPLGTTTSDKLPG